MTATFTASNTHLTVCVMVDGSELASTMLSVVTAQYSAYRY